MAPLDVSAFVEAWTALYAHFDAIGYFPPDYVIHPPFSPPLLALQDAVTVHQTAFELLTQLPHPATYDDSCSFEILPRTRGIPYNEYNQLQLSRDALSFYLEEEPHDGDKGGVLRAEEVLLTTQLPQGWSLVLDVTDGTIREFSTSDTPLTPWLMPDDPTNIHNWPPLPAVETVWSYVRKFESLEWIAFRGSTECGIIESYDWRHARLKQILTDDFGWPGAFRKDEWIRDRDDVLTQVNEELA
ncbi:hypothetical protein PISL3812_03702 [Talaromyces islandicus]|uniref:Knr4/Smi1-like domain-containing protein n=1 Tax=Talaromyces islandicus TaxID=28573 RepID=A0A0U1LUA0_TALIS|nr:hypothetical protein PISL3812_03702 [Talaromyces islandicus]